MIDHCFYGFILYIEFPLNLCFRKIKVKVPLDFWESIKRLKSSGNITSFLFEV